MLNMMVWKSSILAKLVELAALDNVDGVRNRKLVPNMFISDSEFMHMEHVDAKDALNSAVKEGGDLGAEVCRLVPGSGDPLSVIFVSITNIYTSCVAT